MYSRLDPEHVAEYAWAAAHAFHRPGTTEAEDWAADRFTAILAGHAARSAEEMTAQALQVQLPAAGREAVDACARYLIGHLDQLRHNTALKSGWPICPGDPRSDRASNYGDGPRARRRLRARPQ